MAMWYGNLNSDIKGRSKLHRIANLAKYHREETETVKLFLQEVLRKKAAKIANVTLLHFFFVVFLFAFFVVVYPLYA